MLIKPFINKTNAPFKIISLTIKRSISLMVSLYNITIGIIVMLCPCGSNQLFNRCCQPYITKQQLPSTAEQLMRSRFSAYATKEACYIFDTYGATAQLQQSISDIQSWANQCHWLALKIHETTTNTVEFSAYYLINNSLCELREKSNFRLEQGQWRYIDGDIIVNNETSAVKRNELCPCNRYPTSWSATQGRKFKHCCAKKLQR